MSAGEKATEAAALCATVEFEGRLYGLTLCRSLWRDEGTCIFEALNMDRDDVVAHEAGVWTINHSDDGPALLSLELSVPDDLTDHDGALLDALLDQLVERGGGWGIEAHTTYRETH